MIPLPDPDPSITHTALPFEGGVGGGAHRVNTYKDKQPITSALKLDPFNLICMSLWEEDTPRDTRTTDTDWTGSIHQVHVNLFGGDNETNRQETSLRRDVLSSRHSMKQKSKFPPNVKRFLLIAVHRAHRHTHTHTHVCSVYLEHHRSHSARGPLSHTLSLSRSSDGRSLR